MTTLALPPAVTAYANAVRNHLAGLDAETLDELTGGLEADLAEALSERMPDGGASDLAAVTAVFGSPSSYADELRSAAGVELPEPAAGRSRLGVRDVLARTRADARSTWEALLARHALLRGTIDLLVALRPVWWVARGWMLFWMIAQPGYAQPLGRGLVHHLMLIAAVVVSVLWGQGRFGQQRWVRRLGLLASVVAAFALPIVLNMVGHQLGNGSEAGGSSYWEGYDAGFIEGSAGVSATGLTATNLFVYGPDGLPIENAQIVDQDGDPVVLGNPWTGTSWGSWETWEWGGDPVPAPVLDGTGLNIYPWAYVPSEALDWGEDGSIIRTDDDAPDPRWPAATLFPVPTGDSTGSPADDVADAASDSPSNGAAEPATHAPTEVPTGEAAEDGATDSPPTDSPDEIASTGAPEAE